MTHQTPCARPENDPNDWFLRADGRQYRDDGTLDVEDDEITAEFLLSMPVRLDETAEERFERARERMSKNRERAALARRRHAKEACHTDCYFRNKCLAQALDKVEIHGTWGGYFEEELQEIRRQQRRRARNQ